MDHGQKNPSRRSGMRQTAATDSHKAARRRRARWIGAAVLVILVSVIASGSLMRSSVGDELRCAEDAMTGVVLGTPGAPAEMRRCLARARRRGLLDYRPAWLSALGYHLQKTDVDCDPNTGGPLRRGACLLRKGRNEDAAKLYAARLPARSGRYLAGVARRLRIDPSEGSEPGEAAGGPNP